jgi:hypothetical protein
MDFGFPFIVKGLKRGFSEISNHISLLSDHLTDHQLYAFTIIIDV